MKFDEDSFLLNFAPGRDSRLFDGESDFVGGIELGVVVLGDDAQFQYMRSWLNSVQCPFGALEHAQQFTVDISVGVVAAFALGQLVVNFYLVPFYGFTLGRREDFDLSAFGGLELAGGSFCRSRFASGLHVAMLMLLRFN